MGFGSMSVMKEVDLDYELTDPLNMKLFIIIN